MNAARSRDSRRAQRPGSGRGAIEVLVLLQAERDAVLRERSTNRT